MTINSVVVDRLKDWRGEMKADLAEIRGMDTGFVGNEFLIRLDNLERVLNRVELILG